MSTTSGDSTPSAPEPTTPNPTSPNPTASNPTASNPTSPIPTAHTQAMPSGESAAAAPAGATPTGAPAGGYSYPSGTGADPAATSGSGSVGLTDEPAKGTGRRGLVVGGVVAALALGGGVAFGVAKLSGGGAQPSDVLPSNAFAYARLDIDPSASQKVAAVRFLSGLDTVKKATQGDWRKQLWEFAVKDSKNECVSKVDYDTEVAPWIGERAGIGMWPGGTKDMPHLAVVLQTSNEAAAKSTVEKLIACGKDSDGAEAEVLTRDGYVVLTPKGSGYADAVTAGTLTTQSNFAADMTALGETGIASGWMDLKPFVSEVGTISGEANPTMSKTLVEQTSGRIAGALRFDSSYVEVAGVARGVQNLPQMKGSATGLAALPADTVGAIAYSGLGDALKSYWPQLSKMMTEEATAQGQDDPIPAIEEQLGMKADEALAALLGKTLTVSLPDQDWTKIESTPVFGVRIDSDDPKKTEDVIRKIEDLTGESLPFPLSVEGNSVIISSDDAYTAKLKTPGTLGNEAAFKTAVGDTGSMASGLFVNLDKIEKFYLDQVKDEQAKAFLASLSAIGMNASSITDGNGSFSLRLVGN